MLVSTRDRIVTEAFSLFASRGVKATTVDDIATAAGLAPRSGARWALHELREDRLLVEIIQGDPDCVPTLRLRLAESVVPGDVDEERLVEAWVSMVSNSLSSPPPGTTRPRR